MPPNVTHLIEIMSDYALCTGLQGGGEPQRYLWTDAYAVINYLELYRQTDDDGYLATAIALVDQVHCTLGQHHRKDPRYAPGVWLSGLSGQEAAEHPTAGGLRIGKKLPERAEGMAHDSRSEWEQDGQYYHYLTKWMHALNRLSQVTGDAKYNCWARELAEVAHHSFVHRPASAAGGADGPEQVYWKMSVDLSTPLVQSMGHHDPLDGYLTYLSLAETAKTLAQRDEIGEPPGGPTLAAEIDSMRAIAEGRDWVTTDTLGLGGLLVDASRSQALRAVGVLPHGGPAEPAQLLQHAAQSFRMLRGTKALEGPAVYRIAFRELGLAIGLHAVERMRRVLRREANKGGVLDPVGGKRQDLDFAGALEALTPDLQKAGDLEEFWLDADNRQSQSWEEHRAINMCMLATSLAPESFLSTLGDYVDL